MSKKILYMECYSGISGDMTVASLLDLGADKEVLLESLESLNVEGYKIKIERTKKLGIDACDFDVVLDVEHEHDQHDHKHDHHEHGHHHHEHEHNDQHDHEHTHDHHDNHGHEHNHYEHSHNQENNHVGFHFHDQGHTHEHDDHSHDNVDHDHDHSHEHLHDHHHRNISDIHEIIENSKITQRAKYLSKKIFDVVASAESKAHGININEVHFHEVGAIDSIVDIVAAAVCIDNLNIDDVIVSEIYEGRGHVKCQHGIMPVPVPATANIVSDQGLMLKITDNRGEMVTPTGAAIAAALKTKDFLPSKYKIHKIGIGAGKKDFKHANILRTFLIEEISETKNSEDEIWVLETNIDDCSGEILAYTMEKLFESGANDAFFTPIFMKKNRPATKFTVLCSEENIMKMESIIFKNTTTIGIRKHKAVRTVLKRELVEADTKYGKVKVKVCSFDGDKYYYPEYEDVKKISDELNLSIKKVYDDIKYSV